MSPAGAAIRMLLRPVFPWPTTLAGLCRRAAAGDARAFRALYRELHPVVFAYVARRVAIVADAEDLVARVFHRMLDHLHRYDPARASVRGWVITIARNLVVDHHRTARAHTPLEGDGDEGGALPDLAVLEGPDARTLALREHLGRLPAGTREMLALHFADGLRYREIADVVGLSEAAVKQRMARALRELRVRLAEVGGEEATRYAF